MKKVILSLFSVALLLGFISCKSKPAPEEPAPTAPEVQEETPVEVQPVVVEPSQEDDSDRLAKLEERRRAAIEAYQNAIAARELIEGNDWQDYAYSDYESGCDKMDVLDEDYDANGTLDESLFDTAFSCYEDFKKVLDATYRKLAKEERAAAVKAKNDADSVKAGVSRKEQYTNAVEVFKKGDSHFATKNPKAAYECYGESKDEFISIYNDVYEKRMAAMEALEAAKKAVEESATYAEEADRLAPITEEIDGIEDEDAVLLEEDEYEDPEESVVEIEETLEDDFDDESEEVE